MNTKITTVKVSFDHPVFEEDWFHFDRMGAPLFMDAYLKTWGLKEKPQKFVDQFYPYGDIEDAFLLFKGDRFYGRWWSMKKFALTILDYLIKGENFADYLQKKDEFKLSIDVIWQKYDQPSVLALSPADALQFAHDRQDDLIRSWIKDAIAPFIGEVASGYTNWLLEKKGLAGEEKTRVFNLVFAYPKISATIERQLKIKETLDGITDETEKEIKVQQLIRDFAYSKSDFIGYIPFTKVDILKEYDLAQSIKLVTEAESVEREKVLSALNLSREEKIILDVFAYSSFSRDERRAYQQRLFALLDWSLEALSKHYGVPHAILRFATTDELTDENLRNIKYHHQLQERFDKGFMIYWKTRGTGGYMTGEEAWTLFNSLDSLKLDNLQTEFKGQPTFKGKVTGKVRVIMDPKVSVSDEPFILVTGMTSPDYIHHMQKCLAIITNEGGITCHAAILSRELKKPCIIGTKVATKMLKDGDLVEVDAENGIVRMIK